jgi:hypothetical protein
MHKVWFAQGVYGVDFQGMADHGELEGNSLVNKKGKGVLSSWRSSGHTFLFHFKAVDSSAKHSLPYKHYIKF